jgi:hypothetical protein
MFAVRLYPKRGKYGSRLKNTQINGEEIFHQAVDGKRVVCFDRGFRKINLTVSR